MPRTFSLSGIMARDGGPARLDRYHVAAWFVALIVVGRVSFAVLPEWRRVMGWEAYWIAQSLAIGEGFTFPSAKRWLYESVSDGGFHATAWMDPVYAYVLSALIHLFGEYHQLAALIFNLLLLLGVFALTYHLGKRLISAPAGLMAVVALALIEAYPAVARDMNNTTLASALVLLSALALVEFLEGHPTAVPACWDWCWD